MEEFVFPERTHGLNKGDKVLCNPFTLGNTYRYSSDNGDTLTHKIDFKGEGRVTDFVKNAIRVDYKGIHGGTYNYFTRDMLLVKGVDYE